MFKDRYIKRYEIFFYSLILFYFGCNEQRNNYDTKPIMLDSALIDSIKSNSDTFYVKFLGKKDLYSVEYYCNFKSSSIGMFSKDSFGVIRKIEILEKDKIIYSTKYFPNGQLEEKLYVPAGDSSKGEITHYNYQDGIEYTGHLRNNIKLGQWFYFDKNGKLKSVDTYNEYGQLINRKTSQH